jgi:hypothetical protein
LFENGDCALKKPAPGFLLKWFFRTPSPFFSARYFSFPRTLIGPIDVPNRYFRLKLCEL